ncbi:class III lanthionine synthetase LanKC [Actinospica durhamensis]|uniref:Class III lanthionine synthetase LanKC n=1 Tax=Actinospica durhamensis TaxID=1508375 RepID=A0A941IQS6_9ACTN|nr:class III lanthionine synthetase LanKC [Actinospica durhamensis]MBR7834537.1 class III lanthionine synthetase LanKC [Actinospica durhamensis]
MFDALDAALADGEYYAPFSTVRDPGTRFAPEAVADGWQGSGHDIWTVWTHPDISLAEQGWKIHVSARFARAQQVLDTVAQACFAERVPFKHLASTRFFLFLHHKHAPRQQAGKFCAVYPPDLATARRVLDRLADALAGEEGAYVLTDRRYRDSRTVHYRYGAFGSRSRLLPDGTREPLLRAGDGHDVVDRRLPAFVLPPGVADPFVEQETPVHHGQIIVGGYEILEVLQNSNAGGAYRARDARGGRTVFLKEARAHNGYTADGVSARERLRGEYGVLTVLHESAPGLGPEPLGYFDEWEHEFLVTEYLEGTPLRSWIGHNSPLIRADWAQRDVTGYFDACRRVLGSLDDALGSLHALGYRFGDLSPGNAIVTADGAARLVDFETVTPLTEPVAPVGTPGFVPPAEMLAELLADGADPALPDHYALGAVALSMFANLHSVAERAPGNLKLLRRDLAATVAPPVDLWARATAFYPIGSGDAATPEDVDADPLGALSRMARLAAAGLVAMAEPTRQEWVFPPPPAAFGTNTVCLGYGTAGVVYALLRAGVPIPDAVDKRLRRDAMTARGQLPPGLDAGLAGIARVLARLGHLDEALDLALLADEHRLTVVRATLAGGSAGVGLTWLDLYRRTGDDDCLDLAVAHGEWIAKLADPVPFLGRDDARGLFHGRSGLALFLHRLFEATGETGFLEAGCRLLHEELDRAMALDDGALSFSDDAVSRRAMPYFSVGSAGVGIVLTRYVHTQQAADERFAAALPLIVADTYKTCAMEGGLYTGLAGMAWFLAEHAELTADADDRARAVTVATGLLKYAVPHKSRPDAVRFLGTGSLRFSADLSSGSAGVLLAVRRILDGPADDLFG